MGKARAHNPRQLHISLGDTSRASPLLGEVDDISMPMPEAGSGRRQRGRESLEKELKSLNTFYRWGTPRSPRPSSTSGPRGGERPADPTGSVTKRSRSRRRRGNLDKRSIADLESSWQEAAGAAVVAGGGSGSGSRGGRGGSASPVARCAGALLQY